MWKKEFKNRFLPLGRIGRKDYIKSTLFILWTTCPFLFLTFSALSGYMLLLMICYTIFIFWTLFCLAAKRIHDIGYSAWFFVLFFLGQHVVNNLGAYTNEIIGHPLFLFNLEQKISYFLFVLLPMIYLILKPGDKGKNKFGNNPYLS